MKAMVKKFIDLQTCRVSSATKEAISTNVTPFIATFPFDFGCNV